MDTDLEETRDILGKIIDHLTQRLPDPKRASSHLWKFAELNVARIYHLLKMMMEGQIEMKTILKYIREINSRLEKSASVAETLGIFVKRVSLTLVSKDSLPHLLELVENRSDQSPTKTAERLVKEASTLFPQLFKRETESLCSIIVENKSEPVVKDALQALSKLIKSYPAESPQDPPLLDQLIQLTKTGSRKQAKLAASILAHGDYADVVEDLIPTLVKLLPGPRLVAVLSSLSVFSLVSPSVYQSHSATVMDFVMKKIILVNQQEANEDDPEWVDRDQLEEDTLVKLLALKTLVHPILSQDDIQENTLAKSILRLLRTCIQQEGELVPQQPTSPTTRMHLRLKAGLLFLKMLEKEHYQSLIEPLDAEILSLLMQDPVYQVRSRFIEKLGQCLVAQTIPIHYIILLTLVAHDPDQELKAKCKNVLVRHSRQTGQMVEQTFVRLIHLLAHHPDFSSEAEDVALFEAYIYFFLDAVANADNVSYLYYMAGQLKLVRDKTSENSDSMYILSELAQVLIQRYCVVHNWFLQPYPEKVGLPRELFARLPKDVGTTILKKRFLNESYTEKVYAIDLA